MLTEVKFENYVNSLLQKYGKTDLFKRITCIEINTSGAAVVLRRKFINVANKFVKYSFANKFVEFTNLFAKFDFTKNSYEVSFCVFFVK